MNARKLLAKTVENWPVKALSVAAALILFVFHRMSILEDRFFSVPLHVETGTGFIPISSYPRLVRVSLKGDANSIYPILEDDIEAYIDLSKYTAQGWYRSAVQIRKKGTALGVAPLEISVDPMEISIQLDKKAGKTLSIHAKTKGAVGTGFELVSQSLTPAQAMVEGPLSVLTSVLELSTEEIDLEGRTGSFSITARIQNPDQLLEIRGSGTAEFSAVIEPVIQAMDIDGPITLMGLDSRFEAQLNRSTGSVRIEGAQVLLDQFVPASDFFSVDCSDVYMPGDYTLPVLVKLPEGLRLLKWEPMELSLTVVFKGNGSP